MLSSYQLQFTAYSQAKADFELAQPYPAMTIIAIIPVLEVAVVHPAVALVAAVLALEVVILEAVVHLEAGDSNSSGYKKLISNHLRCCTRDCESIA